MSEAALTMLIVDVIVLRFLMIGLDGLLNQLKMVHLVQIVW